MLLKKNTQGKVRIFKQKKKEKSSVWNEERKRGKITQDCL